MSETSPSGVQYAMDIERTIVDKLGVKMYDKVSAVVAELVANSYDADAEFVEVHLPLGKYLAVHTKDGVEQKDFEVIVKDDGHGMTPVEANELFLRVGRDRRAEGDNESREKGRPVMGRKGIGKLAPFGICKEIEIWSAGGPADQDEYEVSHFLMEYEEIMNREENSLDTYYPTPLEEDGTISDNRGTVVRLRNFSVKRVPKRDAFERRLGLRFATGAEDFDIKIVDIKPDEEDPESPFFLSEIDLPLQENTRINLEDKPVPIDDEEMPVEGWMGLSERSYEDEFGGVRIYVRGKLASITRDFGLPPGFTGEFVARSYLIGEIHADWLDEDDDDDLIQTDRQDILWDTEKGGALQEWGRDRVREVAKSSEGPRRKRVRKQFMEESNLAERAREEYDKEPIQQAAIELGETLGQYAAEDELEFPEYVEGLTDFVLEMAPHKHLVDSFHSIRRRAEDDDLEIDDLIELFESTHIAEIATYGQIARRKLNTIEVLDDIIDDYSVNEDELHEIIENSPWLIDPAWRPLTSERSIKTFRGQFEDWWEAEKDGEVVTTTETEYEKKRPDFVMLHIQNAVRVIEIKPPDHDFNNEDFDRFQNYVDAFDEFFDQNGDFEEDFTDRAKFTIIADGLNLGRTEGLAFEHLKDNGTITDRFTWRELLKKAEDHHQDYLDAKDEVVEI